MTLRVLYSTLRVNFKVDSACMPYDSTNLVTQDGCWTIPRVSLVSIICDNGRNDGAAEELIAKPIRKVSFLNGLKALRGGATDFDG